MVVLEEITNTFWGVTLTEGKRFAQTLEGIVHVSMAALEPGSTADDKAVSVFIHHRKSDFVLCSLNSTSILQQSLDLSFNQGEEVAFYLKGKGTVHLTGYVVPGDDYDSASDEDFKPQSSFVELDDDENSSSSDEESDLTKESKKRKKDQTVKQSKKPRVEIVDDDDDDDDEENDESLSSDDDEDKDGENDSEEDDDEDEDEDESDMDDDDDIEDDIEDDDDDDQEDEIPKEKNAKKKNKKPSASPAKQSKELKHNKEKETEKPEEKAPSQSQSETNEKKKKKKKKNKNKKNEATAAGSNSSPEKQAPSKSRLVEDVIIEDLKVGHGSEAKKGSTVRVYYTGKLPNGKLFDSMNGGAGFKFCLGKKQVIKGWEVGVEGMKVGGKRKLVVPPKMGYGSQKVGNSIPPNSTLHFEVELKAVN